MKKTKVKKTKSALNYGGLMLLLFCLSGQIMWSQNNVSGTVLDEYGSPLPGVNVIKKGTVSGVVTDIDGNYSLATSENTILTFSSIGLITQDIPVDGKSVINVTMIEDEELLDEVVVIGYGKQEKEEITGSIATIDVESAIESSSQTSVGQMIQGRASGVQVMQNSGQPGNAVSIRIRGVTSLTGSNEPLYVIDGVQFEAGQIPGLSGEGSVLESINPNDIESISVLKDAAASAIYGNKGANGVVIVTTKTGKRGDAKITLSSQLSVQEPIKFLDMMSLPEYARLQNHLTDLIGLVSPPEFSNPDILGPGTNWQKEIFRKALKQNHQVAFSGASETSDYYISGSFLDQEGIAIGSAFNRFTIRTNMNTKIKSWFKTGLNISASVTDQDIILNDNRNGIVSLSLLQSPSLAVRNPDGSFTGPVDDGNLGSINPVAVALSNVNYNITRSLIGNFYGELDLAEGLSFRSEFGGTLSSNKQHNFTPTYEWGRFVVAQNTLNLTHGENTSWIFKNLLRYNKTFGDKHNLNLMVGQEAQESSWQGTTATARGLLSNDIQTLNLGDSQFAANDAYKGSQSSLSAFSRLIYDFDKRYHITASIRADGTSKFDPISKKQWGYFPSVSASWRVSNEAFMSDFEAIQDIKIKFGYGELGNQNVPGFRYGSTLAPFNTGLGTGFGLSNIANENLTWETSVQKNIGLEFSTLGNKLTAAVELYDKTSKDFLFQLPLPLYLTGVPEWQGGVAPPWVNLGEMNNRGVDVELGFNTNSSSDFNWDSKLTVSHYKNKVVELSDELTQIFVDDNLNSNTIISPSLTRIGNPMALFYGYEVVGLFNDEASIQNQPAQFGTAFSDAQGDTWLGDVQYKDQLTLDTNGDGIPDEADGVINEDDQTIIGNPHPDFTFGFQNSFSYKAFDLSLFLQGSYGNDILNLTRLNGSVLNRLYNNQFAEVANFWTPDNTNTDVPRPVTAGTYNNEVSDRFVEDGSYLRIQNVRLGFTLPNSVSNSLKIKRMNIYGAVQNLHTFTKYKGFDPEIGARNQNALLVGIDNGNYPVPRTFTLGLNLEF